MSNKTALKKILEHPDKDEIISKLIIGTSPKDIHDWLTIKYTNISEAKFVIAEKSLTSFQDNYLDLYSMIREDLTSAKESLKLSVENELELSIQDNPAYKSKMLELATGELDIRTMLGRMIINIETRAAQIFDEIQADPRNINTRNERLLIEYFDTLGSNLERWSKYVLQTPDQVVQHNVTVQHIDQHVQLIQEAIRETLAEIDIETSLKFMDLICEKMNKLKLPTAKEITPTETRLAEVKILNETINKKLNDNNE